MKRIFAAIGELLTVAIVASCAFLLFAVLRSPKLERGERYTFYLGENSSARTVTSCSPLAALFLGDVKGESVVYRGDRYSEFAEKYHAELLFTETVNGAVGYYLYAPRFGEGVVLGGKKVNLQIAVDGDCTVVGTPLIFGGW